MDSFIFKAYLSDNSSFRIQRKNSGLSIFDRRQGEITAHLGAKAY